MSNLTTKTLWKCPVCLSSPKPKIKVLLLPQCGHSVCETCAISLGYPPPTNSSNRVPSSTRSTSNRIRGSRNRISPAYEPSDELSYGMAAAVIGDFGSCVDETPICPICRTDVKTTAINYAITPPDNEEEGNILELRNKVTNALHFKGKAEILLANQYASFLVMKMEKNKAEGSLVLSLKYTWKELEEWLKESNVTIPAFFRLNVLSTFFEVKEILKLPKRTLHVCTAPDVYELEIIA